MSLKLESRFPGGNARKLSVDTEGDIPVVRFTADPCQGPECLWFNFRLVDTSPESTQVKKVQLVLKFFDNLYGSGDPIRVRPVCKHQNRDWVRLKPGKIEVPQDGQHSVSWIIDHPDPMVEVAVSFPYGSAEIRQLTGKTKGYWQTDSIGLSQAGRPIHRLSNHYGTPGGDRPGIYLIARQNPGETPGSWVLDGLLRELARTRNQRCIVWVVPLADIDGIHRGEYGKKSGPFNLNRSWGCSFYRHETLVIQNDLNRWKERCLPVLGVNFQSPGICDIEGIHCYLPDSARFPDFHKTSTGWANNIANRLPAKFAASDFRKPAPKRPGGPESEFISYCGESLKICALTLLSPYSLAGDNLMSRKCYREAGKAIAMGILDRFK